MEEAVSTAFWLWRFTHSSNSRDELPHFKKAEPRLVFFISNMYVVLKFKLNLN